MASGINSFVRGETKSLFPDAQNVVSALSTWNQGDIVFLDPADKLLKQITTGEDGTNVAGIASNSIVAGKIVGPYSGLTDVTEGAGSISGPDYGAVFSMKLKSGDTFTHGGAVYPSQGVGQTREVTSVAGALKQIGIYQGPTVTAGATSEGECLIGARANNDSLKV